MLYEAQSEADLVPAEPESIEEALFPMTNVTTVPTQCFSFPCQTPRFAYGIDGDGLASYQRLPEGSDLNPPRLVRYTCRSDKVRVEGLEWSLEQAERTDFGSGIRDREGCSTNIQEGPSRMNM